MEEKEIRKHCQFLVELGVVEKVWSDDIGDWVLRLAGTKEERDEKMRKYKEEFL